MLIALDTEAARIFSAEGLRWPGAYVISGYRSRWVQAQVNPNIPPTKSLHNRCPSMAADLRVGDQPASTTPVEVWRFLGTIWKSMGGRWGGDFGAGFAGGPTPDLNHFELPAQ